MASWDGLKKWGEKWRNQYVLLHSDNTQVVTMIATGRSKNPQAMCLLREIFWITALYNIDLRATLIREKMSLLINCPAYQQMLKYKTVMICQSPSSSVVPGPIELLKDRCGRLQSMCWADSTWSARR